MTQLVQIARNVEMDTAGVLVYVKIVSSLIYLIEFLH